MDYFVSISYLSVSIAVKRHHDHTTLTNITINWSDLLTVSEVPSIIIMVGNKAGMLEE